MRSAPYSERFMWASGQGVVTTYVVPSGFRAKLKWLQIGKNQGATAYVFLILESFTQYYRAFPDAAASVEVELGVVMYAGELVQIQTSGQGLAVSLSGYLFEDPSGAAAAPGDVTTAAAPDPDPRLAAPSWTSTP